MVAAMVNAPHGLCTKAFTTISANTAMMMIIIIKMPIEAITPATGPSSCLTISPKDLPSRRMETNSTTISCTAPANTTPKMIHKVPGR